MEIKAFTYRASFAVPGSPFQNQTASRAQTNAIQNNSPEEIPECVKKGITEDVETAIAQGKAGNSTRKRKALSNTGRRKPSIIESVML